MKNMVGIVSTSVSQMAHVMLNDKPGTTAVAGHMFTLLPRAQAYDTTTMMRFADVLMDAEELSIISMDDDIMAVFASL